MPIPTYDELLRPLLEMAATQDISRQNATEAMVGRFHLSAEEAAQLLPSGHATTIRNRTGWAMTYLTKAGLIEKVVRGTYRITDCGREFLAKYPQQITISDLETIPGFEDAWNTRARRRQETELSPESPAFDPNFYAKRTN